MNGTIKQLSKIAQKGCYNYSSWSSLASTFNSKQNNLNLNLALGHVGLFNVPDLAAYQGFHDLKMKCISDSWNLIEEATSDDRSRKMVEIFDELSDTLCKVADLAEFIRIAHPSLYYADAAESAIGGVSSLVEKLNTNFKLYSKLAEVVKNGDCVPTNEIDDHVAKLFLFDFEQNGIHLPEAERHKVVMLNDSLLYLGQQFVSGSTNSRYIKKTIVPEKMRHNFMVKGDQIVITGLCVDSSSPTAREIAYRAFLYPDKDQDFLLAEILKARYELAQTCGFPTYAHRALKGSTIETPEMVMEFLGQLSGGLKIRADKDFGAMAKMKNAEYPNSGALAPWDTPYLIKKARKQWFTVGSLEYSPYFSLGACMEGLNTLFTRLYGISLVVSQMMPGECWADDVYKLAVTHETDGLLGYIYCDFYERYRKPNQDCHFTIQGGKMLSNGSYQLPIVVLMLNLPLPNWTMPVLLSPNMLTNLFHEMGHAMHSMLARTHYQHVTGTRCSTDFAEVPAVLMEYFASDMRVLRTFARHYDTKEPMPEDMLYRLCASKHVFTASETQVQLFYSALDQLYHGNYPLPGSTTDVLAQVQNKFYSLPYVENTAWQLRFSHLVGYGAKYYAYLVSQALASCIWQSYFEKDPFNRSQGERFRLECLLYGGGKPPKQLVTDFLQKQPTTELLVKSLLTDIDNKQHQVQQITGRL